MEKGPGDIKQYPSGSKRKLKLQADGNPFPYEFENDAINGVSDDFKVEQGYGDASDSVKEPKFEGEDGSGGHK